jgi:hypothetical protein
LAIFNRVPKLKEILPVYAIIVLMIYGWTILKFNYYVPSWLHFLNIGEILSVFAYSMATNFFESMVVLLGVIAVGAVLPAKWFADVFIARGTSLSILVLGLMMYVSSQFITKEYYPSEIIDWIPAIFLLIAVTVYFFGRLQFMRNAIEFFADRAIVFLYISVPVSVFSLVVIAIRNIV